jgi:hypothetical protein
MRDENATPRVSARGKTATFPSDRVGRAILTRFITVPDARLRALSNPQTAVVSATHTPIAVEIRIPGHSRAQDAAARRVSLWATEDGWSLLAPDGTVMFRGLGLAGRRQCLEYAREHGVLAVYS